MVVGPYDPVTCTVGGATLHSLGSQIGAQTVYVGTPSNCVPIAPGDWTPSYDLYALGAALPHTAFVAGSLMIE